MNRTIQLSLYLIIILVSGCHSRQVDTSTNSLDQILDKFHDPSSQHILITAHRASNTKYPENSLAAIKHSIETGVDIVEVDIRATKEGELVLLHDETLKRTSNGNGNVYDFTYAEVSELRLKKRWRDTINHKIPLAEDALKLVKGKIMVSLDMKDMYVKQLVNLVHKTQTENQVIFFDSSFEILDSVLILDSTLLIMPRVHSIEDVHEVIKRYHPPVIHIDPDCYTDEVVATIKKSGARIWINALGIADIKAFLGFTKSAYSNLCENNTNIIQTDLPGKLDTFLRDEDLR